MILALSQTTRLRLEHIEAEEGVPPIETVHNAVEIWTSLTAGERQALGLAALHLVATRRYRQGETP